jgi:hypothetical protein
MQEYSRPARSVSGPMQNRRCTHRQMDAGALGRIVGKSDNRTVGVPARAGDESDPLRCLSNGSFVLRSGTGQHRDAPAGGSVTSGFAFAAWGVWAQITSDLPLPTWRSKLELPWGSAGDSFVAITPGTVIAFNTTNQARRTYCDGRQLCSVGNGKASRKSSRPMHRR